MTPVLIGWIDKVTFGGASVLPQSYYIVAVRLHHLMAGCQQDVAYVNSSEIVAGDCGSKYVLQLSLTLVLKITFSFLIYFILFTLHYVKSMDI